jgi:putative transposase
LLYPEAKPSSGFFLKKKPPRKLSSRAYSLWFCSKRRRDQDQHGRQGPRRDKVFVERIWKSIKYEEVYLHAYASVSEARTSIGHYLEFYNSIRPHSSLKAQTPDRVCFNRLPESMAA